MAKVRTSDFDYDLPKGFIANDPVVPRDQSKVLIYDSTKDEVFHKQFFEIGNWLRAGDCLVVNRSRVIPARLTFDNKEVFLLRDLTGGCWRCLVKPGRHFLKSDDFKIYKTGIGSLAGHVEDVLDDGSRIIRFDGDAENFGNVPLPPYIHGSEADFSQYQTVFASEKGSVAAPTAGLHFTKELIQKLRNDGILWEEVLLHVGRGTFLPVKSEYIEDHEMHSEIFEFSNVEADRLNAVREAGGRVIAVGTTSVRVLESCLEGGKFRARSDETDIFIYPGSYEWKAINGLVTNFHLPKSTLLMLVASFLEHKGVPDGRKKIFELYEIAKQEGYRFYSFGDAMLII